MTAARAYSAPMPPGEALAELERCAGSEFDAAVLAAFAEAYAGDLPLVRLPAAA